MKMVAAEVVGSAWTQNFLCRQTQVCLGSETHKQGCLGKQVDLGNRIKLSSVGWRWLWVKQV